MCLLTNASKWGGLWGTFKTLRDHRIRGWKQMANKSSRSGLGQVLDLHHDDKVGLELVKDRNRADNLIFLLFLCITFLPLLIGNPEE